jgi:Asp-tRNA(Asn)/Glu-tRNA(Gln) amidotransferase A subunit family amidase
VTTQIHAFGFGDDALGDLDAVGLVDALPAISLPFAESASGLPVGMMFSAPVGQEGRLLELAYELEEARPWARIQS